MTKNLINTTINGYRLIKFISAGGMGEVYQAIHDSLGRVVAVKILTAIRNDQQTIERFMNEARIQSTLRHENIATLYEYQEYNGIPCIIMEYVDGNTLRQHLEYYKKLPISEALLIFRSLVSAVGYLHERGIVHRDIKPDNIKITSENRVKLLDFGIATFHSAKRFTEAGKIVGTTHYMSPERLKGEAGEATSDVWALGVILYEMTAGQLPFDSSNLNQLYDLILSSNYQRASTHSHLIHPKVDNLISKCLRKDAASRFHDAMQLEKEVVDCARNISTFRLIRPLPFNFVSRIDHRSLYDSYKRYLTAFHSRFTEVRQQSMALGVIKALAIAASAIIIFTFIFTEPPSKIAYSESVIAKSKLVEINVSNGPADIYVNNKFKTTLTIHAPYKLDYVPGQKYEIKLKRTGFKTIKFTISDQSHAKKIIRTFEKK